MKITSFRLITSLTSDWSLFEELTHDMSPNWCLSNRYEKKEPSSMEEDQPFSFLFSKLFFNSMSYVVFCDLFEP